MTTMGRCESERRGLLSGYRLLDGSESSIKIEKNETGRACSAHWGGERRGVYRVLVRKPEEKSSIGRPRRRWEDNNKMDLQEVGSGGCGLDRAGSG